jgi:TPR repeat protein
MSETPQVIRRQINRFKVLFLALLVFTPCISKGDTIEASEIECLNENKGDSCFRLAHYNYYKTKYYRKAMHWALNGANLGSTKCMLLLRKAYGEGLGVVQDTNECLKWLFLAAALGDTEAQANIKKLEALHFTLLQIEPELTKNSIQRCDEAKLLAKQWMINHSDLFFNLE